MLKNIIKCPVLKTVSNYLLQSKTMDVTDLFGKPFPQKVTLDCNIETITGELISKGTDIYVLLCDKLISCMDSRNYNNSDISPDKRQWYLNPGSEEKFLDVHCTNKTYKTIDELCEDRPRYFSCKQGFFAMGKDEETIKICDGDEFELNRVQSTSTFSQVDCDSLSSTQQSYTNVSTKTSNIVYCYSQNSRLEVQIPSSCKSSFQSIDDPNVYKPAEIIDRFTLPRHIQIDDNDPKWTVSATIGLHKTILESQTKCCFLLFTLDYEVSEQTHEIQVKDNIKCCKLVDPSVVKLRRRIENSQMGELFDPVYLLESEKAGRTCCSLVGRKTIVPIARMFSGRQNYIGKALNTLHACMLEISIFKV